MSGRPPYPHRKEFVVVLALLATVYLVAGTWRAHEQHYVALGWAGAALGALALFLVPFVSPPLLQTFFVRGHAAIFIVGFTALDVGRKLHYPRAEGLIGVAGALAASAVLMTCDLVLRPRSRLAQLQEAGLLDDPRVAIALPRYLDSVAEIQAGNRVGELLRPILKSLARRRAKARQIRELVAEVDRIDAAFDARRPPELRALGVTARDADNDFRDFWCGVAEELEGRGRVRWHCRRKCRWQQIAWDAREAHRAWIELVAVLADHHAVSLPKWIADEQRRLGHPLAI